MNVLLTGSSGFIGSRLVAVLQEAGFTVRGLDRDRPPAGRTPDDFVQADLLDRRPLRKSLKGIECVLHLAASRADWGISESEYFRDNTEATRALISAGEEHNIRRWIFFSSVSAMGPSDEPRNEESPLQPETPYGRSKAAAEAAFGRYAAAHPEAAVTIVRPSVVYGPGNPDDTNVFRLIDALYRRRFVMVGDGATYKTTSYIENLIDATLFLLDRMQPGLETFIYVDDPVMTTGTIIQTVCEHLDRRPPRVRIPLKIAAPLASVFDFLADLTGSDIPITSDRIEKFCRPTRYDGSAIRQAGFQQSIDNEEALRRTVEWYLESVARASD